MNHSICSFFPQDNLIFNIIGFIAALTTIVVGTIQLSKWISKKKKEKIYQLRCEEIQTTYFEVLKHDNGKSVTKPIKLNNLSNIKDRNNTNRVKSVIEPNKTDIIVRSRIRITNIGKKSIGDIKNHKLRLFTPSGFTFSSEPKIENSTNNIPINSRLTRNNTVVETDWTLLERGYGFDIITDSIIPAGYFTQNILESFFESLNLTISLNEIGIVKRQKETKKVDVVNLALKYIFFLIACFSVVSYMMVQSYELELQKNRFSYNIEIPVEDTVNADLYKIKMRKIFPQFHKYKIESKEEDTIFSNRKFYNGCITYNYLKNTYLFHDDTILLSIPEVEFNNHVNVNSISAIDKYKKEFRSYFISTIIIQLLLCVFSIVMVILLIKVVVDFIKSKIKKIIKPN